MPKVQYKTLDLFSLVWMVDKDIRSLDDAVKYFTTDIRNKSHNALQDAMLTRNILSEVIHRINGWKTLFEDVTDANLL